MGSRLTSEQRQMLEAFLRDQLPESWPQPLRERHAAAKRIAELILVTDGPGGTPEDRRLLAQLLAIKPAAPWSWVERGPDAPYRAWTDVRVPANALERHHGSAQRFARKAVAGWIGHPAVAREVELARPGLNELVAPLLLPDQGTVTLVAAHFLGGAGTYPDGSEWPNPFIGAPADVCELAEAIQPRFVALLGQLAHQIEDGGAPVDATDPGVLLVLEPENQSYLTGVAVRSDVRDVDRPAGASRQPGWRSRGGRGVVDRPMMPSRLPPPIRRPQRRPSGGRRSA
jgi:hypothetical protein